MPKDSNPRRFGSLEVFPLTSPRRKRLSALRIKLKPGAGAPALFHRRTEEFFFVLRGTATGRIGGKSRRFKAGDFGYLPAGTVHAFKAGKRGVEILDIFVPALDLDAPDIVRAGA